MFCAGAEVSLFLMHTSPDMVGLNPFDNLHLNDVALKNTAGDEADGHSSTQSWRKKKSWK